MLKLRRLWCSWFHRSIMFAGGRAYECRRCRERWDNPAIHGPASDSTPAVVVDWEAVNNPLERVSPDEGVPLI